MTAATLIHGDRFLPVADILYAGRRAPPLKDDELLRRLDRYGDDLVVVYTDTTYANRLNRVLPRTRGAQIVLVTHNGDACVGTSNLRAFDADYALRADCVAHWFAQNIAVRDPRLSVLPVGLERPGCGPGLPKEPLLAFRRNYPNGRRHLLYLNHAIVTNAAVREKPYRLFEKARYALVRHGMNGMDYAAYLRDLSNSAYCISPPGNGLDCHRTWEAMYVGCVPIVLRSVMSEALYANLPVLLVDDYDEVNEVVLREGLSRFPEAAFTRAALFFEFYREAIAARCRALCPGKRLRDPRTHFLVRIECWLRARLS